MPILDVNILRAAIQARGFDWQANELPDDHVFRPLGNEPVPAPLRQAALDTAQRLTATRLASLFGKPLPSNLAATSAPVSALPATFDWRTRNVIGPVTDQEFCGSCVSFATTGLVGAMAAIELGSAPVHLSEADQHFCSSHGANCGGWNNGDALNQIKSRGVVLNDDLPYDSAFDTPPQYDSALDIDDPKHPGKKIHEGWKAYCRTVNDRDRLAFHVTEVTAWTGDDRKRYLANVGPLVCGFTVYTDFDSYGVDANGVYRHVTGTVRGGHAVLVVGYSDTEKCWICRNSWGAGFGGKAKASGVGGGFFKIGYGECNIDGEPFYGAQGIIAPADRKWQGWWPVGTSALAPNTTVYGVSRSADKLDIMAVGADSSTLTAAWQPGQPKFQGWWSVKGGKSAGNSSVSAVTRGPDKLDIFCVGTDHHIFTAAWQAGDTQWRGWSPLAGGVAAPNSSVFGTSRSLDKLDVFCVGTDHRIYTAAWQAGDTAWRGWWPVAGGVAAPDTSVTAVSRSADKLDIFCVGTDHRIYTAAWQAGDAAWRGWWPVAGGVAAPGTSVFGVSRSKDKLDIFCVGTDMQVYTAAWQVGDTAWRGWWPVGHLKVAPGTSVFAVSRASDQLDIFAVGVDGYVYTAAWKPGDTQWRGWWRLLGGRAAPSSSVTAVVRSPNHIDVFCVGTDRHVYTAAWQS